MKRILIVTALLLGSIVNAQDPAFTQPMSAFTELNPALMGKDEHNTAFITRRNQWTNDFAGYKTTFLGYYHYASKLNAYWGGDILHDNAGDVLFTSKISLNYAQNLKFGKVLFRPALKAEMVSKSIDYSKLTFGDQIDQGLGFIDSTSESLSYNLQYLNLNAGFILDWKGFNLGFAAHNILQPNESFSGGNSNLPLRMSFTASKRISFKIKENELSFSPYIMYRRQKDFENSVFGLNIQYWKIIIGCSFRNKDAINSLIGFKHKYFSIIYSYDYTVSKLALVNLGGTHEFGIQYHPFQKKKKAHKNLIPLKSAFLL